MHVQIRDRRLWLPLSTRKFGHSAPGAGVLLKPLSMHFRRTDVACTKLKVNRRANCTFDRVKKTSEIETHTHTHRQRERDREGEKILTNFQTDTGAHVFPKFYTSPAHIGVQHFVGKNERCRVKCEREFPAFPHWSGGRDLRADFPCPALRHAVSSSTRIAYRKFRKRLIG